MRRHRLGEVASCFQPDLTRALLASISFCLTLLRNSTIFFAASVFPEPLLPLQEGGAKDGQGEHAGLPHRAQAERCTTEK